LQNSDTLRIFKPQVMNSQSVLADMANEYRLTIHSVISGRYALISAFQSQVAVYCILAVMGPNYC